MCGIFLFRFFLSWETLFWIFPFRFHLNGIFLFRFFRFRFPRTLQNGVFNGTQLPIGITADERVCAGATYAKFFAVMKQCFLHPEMLETPPEQVYYNEGAEFHVEKPANAFVPKPAQQEEVSA